MKNKLICLALCIVMLLSAFLTGCKKDDSDVTNEITQAGSVNARTLTMWVVSQNTVHPDTATLVSNALNTITKAKFKTQLVINFLTESEYESVLSETIRKNEDAHNEMNPSYVPPSSKPTVTVEGETAAPEETDTDENGFVVTRYPSLEPNQVDIIYIDGKDMYVNYINNGWLESLDSELSAASKKIKEYVSATLLAAAKYNGATYAIPNNNTIGEYTYMLLDKELMEECFMDGVYNQGKITGMFNDYIYNYLETVTSMNRAASEQGTPNDQIVPIAGTYEECLNLLAHYWSIDPNTYDAQEDTFSFLGYRYTDVSKLSQGSVVLEFDSLFADDVFNENFIKLNEYRLDGGYFGTPAEGQKAAISFATGDLSMYEVYSESYYPVIVKYPAVDINDAYDNMFGVCTTTVDMERSMQIVTYLNTNAEFRNILQYGVEDVHYQLIESEGRHVVERLNDSYMMDIFRTGNEFLAYPEPLVNQDIWEYGKAQNRQANIEPLLNFDFGQAVLDAASSSAGAPTVGASGYTYTYASGYSKDVLSQDPILKKWFEACDAAGQGVYVRHTSTVEGQNVTAKIYYYHNAIANAAVTVSDANGAISVGYTGEVGAGSDVTVISFYGRKNSGKLNWTATVNGEAAPTAVTYQKSVIDFDFMNTEKYSINFHTGVSKAMISDNAAVWAWVKGCANETNNVATYVKDITANGVAKKMYTYIFYATGLTKGHTVALQPTGDNTTLNLNLQFANTSADLGEKDPKYAIFTVSVIADADVSVNWKLLINGAADAAVVETVMEQDPEFALYGNLDTELVRFVARLNETIQGWIAACTTVEELRALIADLEVLLTAPSKQPFTDLDTLTEKLTENGTVYDYVLSPDFKCESFYWNLYAATNKSAVKHEVLNEETEKLEEVEYNPTCQEKYYYFSSPYMVYYSWLKANGFAK